MPARGQTPPTGFAVALDMHATCSGVWRPACRALPPARAHPTARSPCPGSVQFHWNKEWTTLEKHNYDRSKGKVSIEWFLGGETNLCYNALDRHVANGKGSQVAFHWEGNDVGETRDITYQEMLDDVCRIANVLASFGVKKGEPVAIYLPMIPELPAAMLACARIGAIHSVIFGGFSAESLASRILDAKCRLVITADGVMRGPKLVPLLQITNDALAMCGKEGHAVEHVLCVQRLSDAASPIKTGQITLSSVHKLWSETVCKAPPDYPVVWMGAEDPLFMLYTSGSTGKPKGVVHTTAGYMVWAATTFKYTFDYRPGDIFFCTADCGWITGHSYITYGPMLNCATQVRRAGVRLCRGACLPAAKAPCSPAPRRCSSRAYLHTPRSGGFGTCATSSRQLSSTQPRQQFVRSCATGTSQSSGAHSPRFECWGLWGSPLTRRHGIGIMMWSVRGVVLLSTLGGRQRRAGI